VVVSLRLDFAVWEAGRASWSQFLVVLGGGRALFVEFGAVWEPGRTSWSQFLVVGGRRALFVLFEGSEAKFVQCGRQGGPLGRSFEP
jgi:hypothetical protein